MFQLGKTIVSEDILEKEFVCNLSKCKGACCVAGEAVLASIAGLTVKRAGLASLTTPVIHS